MKTSPKKLPRFVIGFHMPFAPLSIWENCKWSINGLFHLLMHGDEYKGYKSYNPFTNNLLLSSRDIQAIFVVFYPAFLHWDDHHLSRCRQARFACCFATTTFAPPLGWNEGSRNTYEEKVVKWRKKPSETKQKTTSWVAGLGWNGYEVVFFFICATATVKTCVEGTLSWLTIMLKHVKKICV